ncbi:hypothetical protein B0H11DRAFT_1915712 [Mycena galericulata]|nr:hypothetical protein B0H11DRAFT_1915712 [Mycena galericulata]
MVVNFRERADLTKIIKSILDSYPLGNGILRELLQNSDDASATNQTFILDLRTHPSVSVADLDLFDCQGPALLAINDTLFSESDWRAISTLHSSSKTTDETKIGKFGIGVRACYHITDNPHFLSGRKLVIFDPHERFSAGQEGGVMIDVPTEGNTYPDQLAAFDKALSPDSDGLFPGTVVRLPLRTNAQALKSTIKPTVVDPSMIETLFRDFVERELSVVMLFLKHIRYICLKVISPDGQEHFIGSAEISDLSIAEKRRFSRNTGAREETFKCAITVTSPAGTVSQVWRVYHAVRSTEDTAGIMNRQLGYNVGSKLADDKLFSHVALAFPIGLESDFFNGRLFTLLPLPIHTGFPLHLHAILALTQDRQSLRNIEETGTGAESRERPFARLLVTWNRSIFDEFLPATWSALLRVLIDNKEVDNIWAAWPALDQASTSGSSYWSQILPNLLKRVIDLNLPVFPAFPNTNLPTSPQIHVALSSALIASEEDDPALLMVLSQIGLTVVKLPGQIRKALPSSSEDLSLHPNSTRLRNALLACIPVITNAAEEAKDRLLQYLVLAPGKLSNAFGLPLVPLADGSRFSLSRRQPFPEMTPVLVFRQEEAVFRDCDTHLISLSKMSSPLAQIFCSPDASEAVNIVRLNKTIVQTYVISKFGGFHPAEDEVIIDDTSVTVEWLTRFWRWMAESTWPGEEKDGLLSLITRFHLLPSAQGTLRKIESRIILPVATKGRTIKAFGVLGVRFLHPNVVPYSSAFQKFTASATDVSFLIDSISSSLISALDQQSAVAIQEHLVSSLRSSLGKPIRLDNTNRQKFLQLPIFPTRVAILQRKEGSKFSRRVNGPVVGSSIYMRVTDDFPVPITPPGSTFFDVTPSSGILGTIVDHAGMKRALDELGVLEMAIAHLTVQPPRILDALLDRIIRRLSDLSPSARSNLKLVPFVPVVESHPSKPPSSFRLPPTQVIDPRSELAFLYQGEPGKLPHGAWAEEPYLSLLSSHGFYQRNLTTQIAEERITFLSRTWPKEEYQRIFNKAQLFLPILDHSWPSVSAVAHRLTERWLPIRPDKALAAPATCRDSDKDNTAYLFDLVLSVVSGKVDNKALRTVLGWDRVPIRTLQDQFVQTLALPNLKTRGARLHAIISELSRVSGTLSDGEIETLKRIVSGQPWVPVGPNHLLETEHALLKPSRLRGRFHTVPRSLLEANHGQGTIFLQKMGCTESPSLSTLLAELHLLIPERTSNGVSEALNILREMAPMLSCCSVEDHEQIFVPGSDKVLHPIDHVYFVDTASNFLPEGIPVHPDVSESLARDLRVQFLSSLELGEDDDDDDLQMGEELTNRVNKILKEHEVKYALNEFLANAVDAKASKFSVLLDERTFESSKVLGPGLVDLQQRPSLFLWFKSFLMIACLFWIHLGRISLPGRAGPGHLSSDAFQMCFSTSPVFNMNRRFPDQLSVFDSVLPLRNSDQASILSSVVLRVSDCLNLLNETYFGLAKDAMYFTRLEHISAAHQSPMGVLNSLWSVEASRPPAEQALDHEVLSLKAISRDGTTSSQRWLVTKSITPISCVPLEHRRILDEMGLSHSQIGLVVRTALLLKDSANTETPHRFQHEPPTRFLFSSLRLPIKTSLSAHISAQFAISSDRRHIRFEPADTSGFRLPHASFNQWILDNLLPPLYILSIQYAASSSRTPRNPFQWWPENSSDDDSGSISRVIVQAFYDSVVKTSAPICYTVTSQLIAPIDAIFADRTPWRVEEVLRMLETSDFVQLPFAIHRLFTKGAAIADGTHQLRFVDPSSVKEVIISQSVKLVTLFRKKRLDIPTVDAVLSFLLKGTVSVSDLHLIVLADGDLTVGNAQQPAKYVFEGVIPNIFSFSDFLHQAFSKETQNLLIQSPDMNVKRFDAAGVLSLLQRIVPAQSRCIHSPATKEKITRFWEIYTNLSDPPSPSSLDTLPLIPTNDGDYVSLEYCRRDEVMTGAVENQALVSAMQKMNLVFCQVPAPLRHSLEKPFNLQAYLRVIRFKPSPFEYLSLDEIRTVSEWIRSEVYGCTDSESRNVVKGLPIWEARRNNSTLLLPSHELEMLPQRLTFERFDGYIRPGIALANFSHALHEVYSWIPRRETVTSERLAQLLTFPDVLHPSDIDTYSTLLTAFLSLGGSGKIPVPDGDLRLRSPDQLYDHSVGLFSAALQSCERSLFLHPNFRHLQQHLHSKGLQFTVDWDAFLLCARTVDVDLTMRQLPEAAVMQRAEAVYDFYSSRLPNIIMTNTNKWRQLNGLRFVPRHQRRSPSATSYVEDSYCRQFPQIVAPCQILRNQYEEVAWSQRARFGVEPMAGLLALNASLGVPTAQEVVAHLAVLALQVAPEHPGNRSLLRQIRATYQWLNDNREEARPHLLSHVATGPLFLNVDDPDHDPWMWRPAGELMFNVEYDYPETKTFKVHQFLQDYRHLLLAAGAGSEADVDYRPQANAQNGNTLREAFDLMRKQGQLTDVLLMPVRRTDGEAIDRETLRAHSTFLAAAIPHVRDARVGWSEGVSIEHSFPGTYFGARAVLVQDFVYTGKIKREPEQTDEGHMDFLRDLLELLEDADEWDMPELKDEIGRLVKEWKLLSRDTYWMIVEDAGKYQATALLNYCQAWAKMNPASVVRNAAQIE